MEKRFGFAVGWALLIMLLCAIPGRDLPHISFLEILSFDKWVHAGVFFILVILLMRAFRLSKTNTTLGKYPGIIALVLAIPYGGMLEIMQGAFFTDRSSDVYDFIANSVGALAGAGLYPYLSKKFPRLRLT
jgi:VanZ family protein